MEKQKMITDNYKETKRIIKQAMSEKQLVLFVGAGASVNSGMPLWKEAVNQIKNKIDLNDAPDDVIKIPQYYYNSRGQKEYNQLMREIFKYGETLEISEIHKRIIAFKTDTIITTNYDNLIELAAEENGEFMQVISQDKDLPYRKNSRELIKMHGDFEHDNFVLKEDDYLNYSRNFRLIENYIKSIIGTKVVLFVGYSLNDPDVKQIFAWANDILKDDFRRAYLILEKKPYNILEYEYFKNMGINIIYPSELLDNSDDMSHSDQIVSTLDYFLEDEIQNEMVELYNEIKPLSEFEYIYGKYIRRILFKYGMSFGDDTIHVKKIINNKDCSFVDEFWNYINKDSISKDIDISIFDTLLNVLAKTRYKYIDRIVGDKNKKYEIYGIENNEIEENVNSFNYIKLNQIKEENLKKLGNDTPKLYLQQAYISAFLSDYPYAYNCLKNASSIFYKKRIFVWFVISEFNRKYVGKLLSDNYYMYGINEEESKKIKEEVEVINLENIIKSSPDLCNNLPLKELVDFNITYTLFHDMYQDSIKSNQQAKTTYTIFTGTAAYDNLRQQVYDYYKYEEKNYFILDAYRENRAIFILYIRSIIVSVLSENRVLDVPNYGYYAENVKKDKLSDFDVHIILKYLDYSDMKKLFMEYEIKKLPIDDSSYKYIENVLGNISESIECLGASRKLVDNLWGCIEFIIHIDFDNNLAQKVLNILCNKNINSDLAFYINTVNSFVLRCCDFGIKNVGKKQITDFIDYMLTMVINKDITLYTIERLFLNSLYYNYINGSVYKNQEYITAILNTNNLSILSIAYKYLDSDIQKNISEFVKTWKPVDNASDYCLYCDLVVHDIIEKNLEFELAMYDWCLGQGDDISDKNGFGMVP